MKLEKLTTEQEELTNIVCDEWINDFSSKKEIDQEAFEEGLNWIYNELLKKETPKVVYCDSWISCLITIAILKDKGASVWDSVAASVRDSVRDSVAASVWASVWDSVGDSVWDSVGDSLRSSVRDSVRSSVGEYSNYTNSYANYGWVSFYDFFERIGILQNDNFSKYRRFIKSGAFQVYEYENVVFAIQPPLEINRNAEGQLHNVKGIGVRFRDGSGYYYVNGREMPYDLFEKTLTKERFLKEENEDIKAGIITIIKEREGQEGLLKFLAAELVDEKTINHSESYSEILRLYKTKEKYSFLQDRHGNMGQPYCWSEMKCPSTGSTYLIENSSDFDCAIEAAKFLRPSFVPAELDYQWTDFAN